MKGWPASAEKKGQYRSRQPRQSHAGKQEIDGTRTGRGDAQRLMVISGTQNKKSGTFQVELQPGAKRFEILDQEDHRSFPWRWAKNKHVFTKQLE